MTSIVTVIDRREKYGQEQERGTGEGRGGAGGEGRGRAEEEGRGEGGCPTPNVLDKAASSVAPPNL